MLKVHIEVQWADNLDECLSESFINAIVPFLIGLR